MTLSLANEMWTGALFTNSISSRIFSLWHRNEWSLKCDCSISMDPWEIVQKRTLLPIWGIGTFGGGAQMFWIACYCSIPYHTLTNTWSQQDEHASLCRRLGSRIPTLLKSNLAWDSPRGNKKMKNRIFSSCFMNQSKMLWRQVRELNILFNLETSIWKAGNFPLRVNWIWCQIHTHGINWLLYFQHKVSKPPTLVTHVKQTLAHGLWFSRSLLLNELLNISLLGWGGMEKHTCT